MNVGKAIEIKLRTGDEFLATDPDDNDEADRLSMKALERVLGGRYGLLPDEINYLPGETR